MTTLIQEVFDILTDIRTGALPVDEVPHFLHDLSPHDNPLAAAVRHELKAQANKYNPLRALRTDSPLSK